MRIFLLVAIFCGGCLGELVPLHKRNLQTDAGPSEAVELPDLGAAAPSPGDGG